MRILLIAFAALLLPHTLLAGQSVILDADGYACMGDDKSRKQTEELAVKDAKRSAAESAVTYIRSETQVKDSALEQDLISAYSSASVKLLKELHKEWYRDAAAGDCFRVRLNFEVVPDEKAVARLANRDRQAAQDDPAAPLAVKVWTAKSVYAGGEKMRVFIRGNRPFYGRVVYQDASGARLQILPNPYRKESYFNGGVVYEIPSGEDRFELVASPPYGTERVTLYASTSPVGEVELTALGGVYEIKSADVGSGTRGIKLAPRESGAPVAAAFAEASAELGTAEK
ncbi:MAG: DUF4384 domain-containing protein [Deltaproteobacteria bacterium]|nr:DUF4384 domain-containing protein [Deltaproteobacteria bacterium]